MGARTPNVSIAGTIVTGGFSWLSGEHGCISDPANMLDAKVVKYDGSIIWASAEPDLLWTCRGGGGGFGGRFFGIKTSVAVSDDIIHSNCGSCPSSPQISPRHLGWFYPITTQ